MAAIAGLAVAPFTGGASAVAGIAGLTATTAALTISTTELIILCGTAIAITGIVKGGTVEANLATGRVIYTPEYTKGTLNN